MDHIPYGQYAGSVAGPLLALMALGFTPSAKAAAFPFAPGVTGLLQGFEAKRDRLKADGNAIVTLATSAGGYTQEQRDKQASILAEIQQLDADIAMEKQAQTLLATAPAVSILDPVGSAPEAKAPTPFRSLGEQLRAVHAAATQGSRAVDARLVAIDDWNRQQAAALGANETVGSDGGFAVQSDFQNELLDMVVNQSILAPRCRTREIGPNSNGTKFNMIDETSRADGSRYGGVRAYWTGEAGALTGTRPKMSQQEITLQKLTGLYYATDEELGDDVSLTSAVNEAFPEEFAFKVDDGIVRGTGAGMPLGWLNAGALVTVSKETGQAADTILAENVEKMFARLWAPSMRTAIWYVNQAVYPQLFQMQHVIGTGGIPVFMPPGGLSEAPFGTLFGRPIEPIEQASALGDLGDISLVDLNQYQLIRKGAINQAASIHVAFTTDETAFRWVLRINGRPRRLSALTPYKGADTLSSFVTLQAR